MPLIQVGPPQWIWERTVDPLKVEVLPTGAPDGHTVYELRLSCGREIIRLQFFTRAEIDDFRGQLAGLPPEAPAAVEPRNAGTSGVVSDPDFAPRRSGHRREMTHPRTRKLLIVDDDQDVGQRVVTLLQPLAYVVRCVATGGDAVQVAGEWLPDLVLCDLPLASPDAREVARRLRALPGLERVTLIALADGATVEDEQQARAAGFEHVVVKPFDSDRLLSLAAQV
jgi:CheY-like chemotaxis protein